MSEPLTPRTHLALTLAGLTVIAIRFAEPLQDGDLFWHMAYARDMLARATLIPDHAAFSWTPVRSDMIYCAWASELFFYALWQQVGVAGLFLFRYAAVLAIVALGYAYARRLGIGRAPLTYLILIILVLASYTGTLVKPEIFSLLGMNLLVNLYFNVKPASLRAKLPPLKKGAGGFGTIDLPTNPPQSPFFKGGCLKRLYLVPLLLLIWANCHGGFMLAAPFLLLTAVGEGMNLVLSPRLALPRRTYAHLLASWALCAVAIVVTPYGLAYPHQLLADYLLGGRARPDTAWNAAHRSVTAAIGEGFYFEELFVLMASLLIALSVLRARRAPPGARVDWALLLINLGYIPLYLALLRGTFYWPAAFAYTALHQTSALASSTPTGSRRPWLAPALRECTVALFLFLAARSCFTAWVHPWFGSWLGFGISYINPVAEAEYLAQHRLGPRLYNIFDSGGYLLWRLDPTYKVMTDSRSFPYLDWFDDQYQFTMGDRFDDFLARYRGDVAVIDLAKEKLVRNFAAAPDWRLVFYGPTAAIFVPRERAPGEGRVHVQVDGLRNANTALRVADFALDIGDLASARRVLDQVEATLRWQVDRAMLAAARERLAKKQSGGLSADDADEELKRPTAKRAKAGTEL